MSSHSKLDWPVMKNQSAAKIGPAGPILAAKTSPLANFGPSLKM